MSVKFKIEIEYDKDTGKINLTGPVEQPIIFLGMLDYARLLVHRNEENKRVAAGLTKEVNLQAPALQMFKNKNNGG